MRAFEPIRPAHGLYRAAPFSSGQQRPASMPRIASRLAAFGTLMKPRVMALAVFTAFVGLTIAPVRLAILLQTIIIAAIAAGAGAAGALNMWHDADIDGLMSRTARRPVPAGAISRREALIFGLILASCAVVILALTTNLEAAALLAFAIFFYVVVYTMWLKRRTPLNVVIGGAAGALPPVIGWVAASGRIALMPVVLFLIIFLWTPPHFWALSLNRAEEYSRAGVPILPVVAGRAKTIRQILIYTILLFPVSLSPWALGYVGALYSTTVVALNLTFIWFALRLAKSAKNDRGPPRRLFAFSIVYLFTLFSALLLDSSRWYWRNEPLLPVKQAAAETTEVKHALPLQQTRHYLASAAQRGEQS